MTNKKKRSFTFFVIAIVVIILGIRFCKSFVHDTKFSTARDTYRDSLKDIENYSDENGIIKSVSINTDFYDSGSGNYYNKVDYVEIEIMVSDNVENMSAQEKCSLLHEYQTDIENLIKVAKEESGYEKILQENESSNGYIKYKGKYVYVDDSIHIDFVSSQYEYAFYPSHFYVTKKNMGGSTEYSYKFENDILAYFNDTDTEKKQSAPDLPYLGMREEYLQYTSLGKADSVEKCLDFDSLVARARSKTYEWKKTSEHGWYKITVRYRLHHSHNVDDYEDLPASNGYVSNITYTDENGNMQTENYVDTY